MLANITYCINSFLLLLSLNFTHSQITYYVQCTMLDMEFNSKQDQHSQDYYKPQLPEKMKSLSYRVSLKIKQDNTYIKYPTQYLRQVLNKYTQQI